MKENIILNSPQDIAGYVVTVYTENITARLLENREIEFVNADGEVIFTMTSPYMYDSAGELSEEIAVELIDRGDVYYIFMTPDADWLADESRVYPITIDPQVTTSSSAQNIIDNYVMENSGVQTYTLDRLYIGKKNGNRTRAFIKFTNMPTIPTGSTITATQMTLWLTTGQSTGSNAAAYIVNGGDWSSTTISWANMPSASGPVSVDISHNNLTKYVFPCNYAVRTWYSGSTTGQNKNYGIMVRYYDESINDYNPIYSADYTTASKRPSLTITYQLPSTAASITEGSTYTLSSSGMSGTITWVSDNTSVATVNSSGKVTGVKAGKATITASVGGVVQKGFVVYVKIANGVYSIKSMSTGFYLGTYGGISEGTTARLFAKSSAGLMQVQQLWKITYLESGYYSIRPMHKLDMGLTAASNTAMISTIGTTDSLTNIPLTKRWTIQYNSTGYQFLQSGTISQTLRPADGTSSPGLGVITAVGQSSNTFRWTLEYVTSINNQIVLYDTLKDSTVSSSVRYILFDRVYPLAAINLAPAFISSHTSNQDFTWWSTNPEAVAVNASTGTITALQENGRATIVANKTYNGVTYSVSYTAIVSQIPQATLYGITNSGHDHISSLETVQANFNRKGSYAVTLKTGVITATVCKDDLMNTHIFASRSHGISYTSSSGGILATGIVLNDLSGNNISCLLSNSVSNMTSSSLAISTSDSFGDLNLALFIGCQTAAGGAGGNNLPTKAVSNGAQVAIGFKESIGCDTANTWTTAFFESFLDGTTARQAVAEANKAVNYSGGLDSVEIIGNQYLTINDILWD